ncbi:hypothetical protein CSC73_18200 [Pseudoxanthomonas sacheonensis]|nr:phage holin family protein [Pseudoxanthomonas sacheonensis]KAF1705858.1 hypothetical protein CSC73_18200 [Pseudoxanthomonas sacheonensis]
MPGASAGDEPQADVKPPHLDESVRRIGAAGKATLASARDTGRALRRLISADLALARSAMGRALAWVAVGIVFGASAWLLVVGALIAVLQRLGWSWLQSLSFAAVLSSVVTAVAVWRTIHYFECAGLHATRRQLARLGIGDEGEEEEDGKPGTPP